MAAVAKPLPRKGVPASAAEAAPPLSESIRRSGLVRSRNREHLT
jgi:hypothetical protein